MLPQRYVQGVNVSDYTIRGIFEGYHPRLPGRWRYYCSFEDGRRHKAELFAVLGKQGQVLEADEWDLHHVVEKQDYAAVDFTGRLEALYNEELPCVLLSKAEHHAYNRTLHIAETKLLFHEPGLPGDPHGRSRDAFARVRNRAEHGRLRARVEGLRRLYRELYCGDAHLLRISDNVLKDTLRHLR